MDAFPFVPGSVTTVGTGAPTSTPTAVGDRYYDTTAKEWYEAVGTSSSADWSFAKGEWHVETVSGGVVTSIDMPFAFVAGRTYELEVYLLQSGSGLVNMGLTFDDDSAGTNYNNGGAVTSAAVSNVAGGTFIAVSAGETGADGEFAFTRATLNPYATGIVISSKVAGMDNAYQRQYTFHYSGGLPASVGAIGDVASRIGNDSYVAVRRIK